MIYEGSGPSKQCLEEKDCRVPCVDPGYISLELLWDFFRDEPTVKWCVGARNLN